MKKKIISLMMACILMTGLFACGSTNQSQTPESVSEKATESQAKESSDKTGKAETKQQEAETNAGPEIINVSLIQDGKSFEIWNSLVEPLKEEGIELKLNVYYDSEQLAFIMQNDSFDDLIVSYTDPEGYSPIGYTAFPALNLYSTKYSSVEEIIGANAFVGVPFLGSPNGVTVHALKVLGAMGLITFKDDSSANLLEAEREENVPMRAVFDVNFPDPEALKHYDTFVAFGYNEAYEPIFTDPYIDDESEWEKLYCPTEYTKDQAKLDTYEKVLKAYHSEAVKELMTGSQYVPAGWDRDLISQYR